jgi:hypothetical protein
MRTTYRGMPQRGRALALATAACLVAGAAVAPGQAAEPPPPAAGQQELPAPAKLAGVQPSGAHGPVATPAAPDAAELAAAKGIAAPLHRAPLAAAKAPPAAPAGAKAPAVSLPEGLDRSGVVGTAPRAATALAGADLAAATGRN